MRLLLPLLLATVLFFIACADDDLQPRRNETALEALDRLVPITQTGAGTFGCLLNGELWIPEAVFEEEAVDIVAGTTTPNNITITADKQPIYDSRDHMLIIGTLFDLGSKTRLKKFSRWADNDREDECLELLVDTLLDNYILVRHFNSENKTISGSFEAIMTKPNCPQDTIRLTEGRFDLPYRD